MKRPGIGRNIHHRPGIRIRGLLFLILFTSLALGSCNVLNRGELFLAVDSAPMFQSIGFRADSNAPAGLLADVTANVSSHDHEVLVIVPYGIDTRNLVPYWESIGTPESVTVLADLNRDGTFDPGTEEISNDDAATPLDFNPPAGDFFLPFRVINTNRYGQTSQADINVRVMMDIRPVIEEVTPFYTPPPYPLRVFFVGRDAAGNDVVLGTHGFPDPVYPFGPINDDNFYPWELEWEPGPEGRGRVTVDPPIGPPDPLQADHYLVNITPWFPGEFTIFVRDWAYLDPIFGYPNLAGDSWSDVYDPPPLHVSAARGDDVTGNGSKTSPFRSIERAYEEAVAFPPYHQFIHVAAGDYIIDSAHPWVDPNWGLIVDRYVAILGGWKDDFSGRFDFTQESVRSGTAGTRITIDALNDGVMDTDPNAVITFFNAPEPTLIEGVYVEAPPGTNNTAGIRADGGNLVVSNCTVIGGDGSGNVGVYGFFTGLILRDSVFASGGSAGDQRGMMVNGGYIDAEGSEFTGTSSLGGTNVFGADIWDADVNLRGNQFFAEVAGKAFGLSLMSTTGMNRAQVFSNLIFSLGGTSTSWAMMLDSYHMDGGGWETVIANNLMIAYNSLGPIITTGIFFDSIAGIARPWVVNNTIIVAEGTAETVGFHMESPNDDPWMYNNLVTTEMHVYDDEGSSYIDATSTNLIGIQSGYPGPGFSEIANNGFHDADGTVDFDDNTVLWPSVAQANTNIPGLNSNVNVPGARIIDEGQVDPAGRRTDLSLAGRNLDGLVPEYPRNEHWELVDLEGNVRTGDGPSGLGWSIGAFEYDHVGYPVELHVTNRIGSDTYPLGTQDNPLFSPGEAIVRARAEGFRRIKVAAGVYFLPELLGVYNIDFAVEFLGGYRDNGTTINWSDRRFRSLADRRNGDYRTEITSGDPTTLWITWGANSGTIVEGFTIRNGGGLGANHTVYLDSAGDPQIRYNTILGGMVNNNFGLFAFDSSPTILGNRISGGSGDNTAGVGLFDCVAPRLINNEIYGGNGFVTARGILIDNPAQTSLGAPILHNTIHIGDGPSENIGVFINGDAHPRLVNNLIFSNGQGGPPTGPVYGVAHNSMLQPPPGDGLPREFRSNLISDLIPMGGALLWNNVVGPAFDVPAMESMMNLGFPGRTTFAGNIDHMIFDPTMLAMPGEVPMSAVPVFFDFEGAIDWRLTPGTPPEITNGLPLSGEVTTDIEGRSRSRWTLGAYEY